MRFRAKTGGRLWPLGFLLARIIVSSAASPETSHPKETLPDREFAARNQGYSLLYSLMADEKDVSKVLWIKKEKSDVGELIREIARTSAEAVKQLEAYAKADPHLQLKMTGLPQAEQQTRDLISKTRAKELLSKKGENFEVRILLTQGEALTYGSHLAAIVQNMETEPVRKRFLGEVSEKFARLHQRLIDLFHTRWREPIAR